MKYDTDEVNRIIGISTLAEMAGAKFIRSGPSLRSPCPLHNGGNPTGFSVDIATNRWKCWSGGCGHGDSIDFVMRWRRIPFDEACEWLLQKAGKGLDPELKSRVDQAIKDLETQIARASELLTELKAAHRWQFYYANLNDESRAIWRNQGIPDVFQDIWKLGYDPNHWIWIGKEYFTPTLTIPIFAPGDDLRNIRHRLLNPPSDHDKYRPEKSGIPNYPFICNTSLDFKPKRVIIVEGEKKAMVVYITLDDSETQVIGMPGKTTPVKLLDDLVPPESTVFVAYDPDALAEANAVALHFDNSFVSEFSEKVDDLIIECGVDGKLLNQVFAQSRKPVGNDATVRSDSRI